LWEVEFKGNRLINLLKEILRQRRIHAVAWVLLVAFSEIYSEFWEQKVKQNIWETCYLVWRAHAKIGLRKVWFACPLLEGCPEGIWAIGWTLPIIGSKVWKGKVIWKTSPWEERTTRAPFLHSIA
jgi:hypothetical protein